MELVKVVQINGILYEQEFLGNQLSFFKLMLQANMPALFHTAFHFGKFVILCYMRHNIGHFFRDINGTSLGHNY